MVFGTSKMTFSPISNQSEYHKRMTASARAVVQWVEPLPATLALHKGSGLGCSCSASGSGPAGTPGRVAEDGSSAWAPPPTWETWSSPGRCGQLGNESTAGGFLGLSSFCSSAFQMNISFLTFVFIGKAD